MYREAPLDDIIAALKPIRAQVIVMMKTRRGLRAGPGERA